MALLGDPRRAINDLCMHLGEQTALLEISRRAFNCSPEIFICKGLTDFTSKFSCS